MMLAYLRQGARVAAISRLQQSCAGVTSAYLLASSTKRSVATLTPGARTRTRTRTPTSSLVHDNLAALGSLVSKPVTAIASMKAGAGDGRPSGQLMAMSTSSSSSTLASSTNMLVRNIRSIPSRKRPVITPSQMWPTQAPAPALDKDAAEDAPSSYVLPVSAQVSITPDIFSNNIRRFEDGQPLSVEVFSDLFRNLYAEGGVFANADCPLNHIDAWGFDYDYTISNYNANMCVFIYEEVAKFLVEKRKYPPELLALKYDDSFSVRGLLFDSVTGFFMKLDQYNKIQTDTVFFGRQRVSVQKVVEAYDGVTVTRDVRLRCAMFADLFAAPEVCLLADVIELFKTAGVSFHPKYVQQDVRDAVSLLHTSGRLHSEMIARPERYFDPAPDVGPLLAKLKQSGKYVFLLTNSPYSFVDLGMQYILKDFLKQSGVGEWKQLFDVVMFSAHKPKFYTSNAPFRRLDTATGAMSFSPVNKFVKGEVYTEGCLKEFTRLTGINGRNVLYVGDHVMNDLAEPTQAAVWRTCAIIKEISREIKIMQSASFQRLLRRLMTVEALVSVGQALQDPESRQQAERLRRQRDRVRKELRASFNQNFGSVFRTNTNRSLFFFELCKHADIYTSSISNFLQYPLEFTFYSIRTAFPHEGPISWASLFSDPVSPDSFASADDYLEDGPFSQQQLQQPQQQQDQQVASATALLSAGVIPEDVIVDEPSTGIVRAGTVFAPSQSSKYVVDDASLETDLGEASLTIADIVAENERRMAQKATGVKTVVVNS